VTPAVTGPRDIHDQAEEQDRHDGLPRHRHGAYHRDGLLDSQGKLSRAADAKRVRARLAGSRRTAQR